MIARVAHVVLLLVGVMPIASVAQQAKQVRICGVVLDEKGRPISDVDVAFVWSANGTQQFESNGNLLEDHRKRWGNVGQLDPKLGHGTKTDEEGQYVLELAEGRYSRGLQGRAVMAMDKSRRRGGITTVDFQETDASFDITVRPLVNVHGKFTCTELGKGMDWTYVNITDPKNGRRLLCCGTLDGEFPLKLPPGTYKFEAYGELFKPAGLTASIHRDLTITADKLDVDLGVLDLKLSNKLKSKLAGTWGDLTKYYGKQPPAWHVSDARGAMKNVRLSDYQGKWVWVYIFHHSCYPCVTKGLPELMRFYEEHDGDRDQFEIVAFHNHADSDDVETVMDLDQRLQPIVENVWNGKPLPFPLLLDATRNTTEAYGIESWPTVLLIDPQGHLVEGGSLEMLNKELED